MVKISNETGLVQQDVADVIQRTLDYIVDSLAAGANVEFRNFGIFGVKLTKSRLGRNPKVPNIKVEIPPRAVVKFKSGKIMRQKVTKLSPVLKRGRTP